MDEDALLQAARRLDPSALTFIYDHYSAELYAYAMRLLGDAQQAEDCLSETFTRLLASFKAGGGPRRHLRAYLYRVAHNWVCDLYRRQPATQTQWDVLEDEDEQNDHQYQLSPSDAAELRDLQARARSALQRLTPDQRQVVMLKFLHGWENEEIAAALNKPVGAVKALQHRALAALQRLLNSGGDA
ncbi:MAG: sigma-70 family RNA polymerase sigma factor [Anaerolineae bacterium]|nr:sigma-70 family RNA polymerase sigma factor [Anaerolineae bacterium]